MKQTFKLLRVLLLFTAFSIGSSSIWASVTDSLLIKISALHNVNANIIFAEHRYFLEPTPKPLDWKYLTAENSAYDLHNVTTAFKKLYKGKWIATGISKGGQTALIYRAFFPDDVDVSVPYVAPLCKGREDGRHEPFLRDFAGTQQERDILTNFQKDVLKRRGEIQPKFDSLCNARGYKFNLPLEQISSPDYFVNNSPTAAFFVQAYRELLKLPSRGLPINNNL